MFATRLINFQRGSMLPVDLGAYSDVHATVSRAGAGVATSLAPSPRENSLLLRVVAVIWRQSFTSLSRRFHLWTRHLYSASPVAMTQSEPEAVMLGYTEMRQPGRLHRAAAVGALALPPPPPPAGSTADSGAELAQQDLEALKALRHSELLSPATPTPGDASGSKTSTAEPSPGSRPH